MSDISQKTSGFVRDLGEAARQNPLSAALIGMGVLWLFTGGRTERAGEFVRHNGFDQIPDAADDAFKAAPSTFRSGADGVGERVGPVKDALRNGGARAVDNATRLGRDYANTASEYVSSIPAAGAEMFGTLQSNLADVFRAQPLALGAIGLAIGAGIAGALPSSDLEAAYLGETSDVVKGNAAEFASEQATRATKVAGDVIDAVTEEARGQGLTVEDAKSAVGDFSAKVGRVVDAAGKGISEKGPPSPKAKDQSHKPASHIEETARLASSVETAKDPGKVRKTKD
jgi:hypothetical protein